MRGRGQQGFTYLAILFALAIGSVALSGMATLWSLEEQRERERSLLFVGGQYRQAIASYYAHTPGGTGQFPRALDELLEDRRATPPLRHLRQPYADPVSGQSWGLVRTPDQAIAGVYSVATGAPLQRANFDEANGAFQGKRRYADWLFVYSPHRTRELPAVFLPVP